MRCGTASYIWDGPWCEASDDGVVKRTAEPEHQTIGRMRENRLAAGSQWQRGERPDREAQELYHLPAGRWIRREAHGKPVRALNSPQEAFSSASN